MNTELRDKLFTVIRSGLGLEVPTIQISDDEYSALLQIGLRQSILPILHRGLQRLETPAEVLSEFDRYQLKDMGQTIRTDNAIERISAILDAAGIPYVLLKGAVLRYLYPEKNLRTSSDIDILVQEKDLDAAVSSIEAATSFKTKKCNYHDVYMASTRVNLELHFSIKENMENIDQLLVHVWDYAEPTGDGNRYVFTPEFQVFHVIAHMSYHMVHGGLGIRPFLDLWLLRTKTEFDEDLINRDFTINNKKVSYGNNNYNNDFNYNNINMYSFEFSNM